MYRSTGGEGESEGQGLLAAAQQQPGLHSPTSHRYEAHHHLMENMQQQQQRHTDLLMPRAGDLEKGHRLHHSQNRHNSPMDLPRAKRRGCFNCFGANKCQTRRASLAMSAAGGAEGRRGKQPRLVDKDGECIIRPNNLRGSFGICLRNWFHLLIEHSWRRIFLIFSGSFATSWFSFGLVYFLIQHYSGDLQHLAEQHQCIANVHSLSSAFLFSLESQHTIGYGTRYMTEMCPLAYLTLSLQCIVGVLLQTILAGIVIAKILRPKKRKQEMRFSSSAVIGPVDEEDQRPALMIRLADIQHRLYIAESHVRLYMATTKINKHGGCELIGVQDMNVGYDTGMDRVLLLWPVVIRHIVDQDSPLWEITEEKLKSCQFELIMTVEGIVEATGMAFQARTSFLPDEILWAQRFVPLIALNPRTNLFEVDYDLFDVTEPHPLEPWLPVEEEQEEAEEHAGEECLLPTAKLSVISELDSAIAVVHHHNNGGGTFGTGAADHHAHGHVPNGFLPSAEPVLALPPNGHPGQFRRKSTCSIAESIRSGKLPASSMPDETGADLRPAPRKSSRTSLLHVLLRRTQTNDSSPLVSNNNIGPGAEEGGGDGGGGTLSPGADGLSCSPLPPLPASPFVVHTLQHSGFT